MSGDGRVLDAIGRDHTRCVACRNGVRYSHNPIVAQLRIGPPCPHSQFVACSVCRFDLRDAREVARV